MLRHFQVVKSIGEDKFFRSRLLQVYKLFVSHTKPKIRPALAQQFFEEFFSEDETRVNLKLRNQVTFLNNCSKASVTIYDFLRAKCTKLATC